MSWNYRVIHQVYGEEDTYCLHEVYYDAMGNTEMWAEGQAWPQGETVGELREDLGYMMTALDKPVLEITELPGWNVPPPNRVVSEGIARLVGVEQRPDLILPDEMEHPE